MEIYIPTYGRVDRQATLENLPEPWRDQAVLVVYREEAPLHVERGRQILVVPSNIERGIANKRQFIMDQAISDKVVMFDDDLAFFVRRKEDPTRFVQMEEWDYNDMFMAMDRGLDDHYHGGLGFREGGNRYPQAIRKCARIMRAHCYRKDMPARFIKSPGLMEDFHLTLDLLTQGHPNIVLNNYVTNQRTSNWEGGVSNQRTREVQRQAAEFLAECYPDFVTVVKRMTKGAWGGGIRHDVRVQWKKAYNYGLENAPSEAI